MSVTSSSPSSLRVQPARTDASVLAASCLLGAAGYGFYCGLPVMLGGLADARGIAAALLGWIASAEILGLLLGGLVGTWLTARLGRRRLAIAGVAMVASANLASMSPELGVAGLIAIRLLGGVGGGCIYALGVSSLALTSNPARSVAWFSAILTLVATGVVGLLPIVLKHGGLDAGFLMLLGMAAISMLGIGRLPESSAATTLAPSRGRGAKFDRSVWILLTGMACFHVAPVIYWTYGERIGMGAGIPEATLGLTFAVSGVLGTAACFCTEGMARRLGQVGSLRLVTMLLIGGLLSWLVGTLTPVSYLVRACLVTIPWAVGGVFQVNLANEIDPSGRLSALVGPAQNVGLMAGPAVASTLLSANLSFSVVLGVATAFLLVSMMLSVVARRPP